MEVLLQGQHRISAVYLKKFAFKKDGKFFLSVIRRNKGYIEKLPVDDFSKEVNIFDIPAQDVEDSRIFENWSSTLESSYPRIIKHLVRGEIPPDNLKSLLSHYIGNMLCRSKDNQGFFSDILDYEPARSKFFKEITVFSDQPDFDYDLLHRIIKGRTLQEQVNICILWLSNHFAGALHSFNHVYIKTSGDRPFITTDNPVVVDAKNDYSYLIHPNTELYFPLSKNFCIFLYHNNASDKSNPLRNWSSSEVHQADEGVAKRICDLVFSNPSEHLILPSDIGDEHHFDQP